MSLFISYKKWWSDKTEVSNKPRCKFSNSTFAEKINKSDDNTNIWTQYYKPKTLTTISKKFMFSLVSTEKLHIKDNEIISPFVVHTSQNTSSYPNLTHLRFGKWFSLSNPKNRRTKSLKKSMEKLSLSPQSSTHSKSDLENINSERKEYER